MKLSKLNFVTTCSFLVLLTSVIAKADIISCQSGLHNSGGLSGDQAAEFCTKNSSVAFINCQYDLHNYGGLPGYQAAEFCLRNSSNAFRSCQASFYNNGGLSAVKAANACIGQTD